MTDSGMQDSDSTSAPLYDGVFLALLKSAPWVRVYALSNGRMDRLLEPSAIGLEAWPPLQRRLEALRHDAEWRETFSRVARHLGRPALTVATNRGANWMVPARRET